MVSITVVICVSAGAIAWVTCALIVATSRKSEGCAWRSEGGARPRPEAEEGEEELPLSEEGNAAGREEPEEEELPELDEDWWLDDADEDGEVLEACW